MLTKINLFANTTGPVGSIEEVVSTITNATGVVEHDISSVSTFYHSSISSDFTANITNVPTTDNRVIVIALILAQGTTAYLPTAVQIDGNVVTPVWIDGITPEGTISGVNVVSYSLLRVGSAWTVIASISSFE